MKNIYDVIIIGSGPAGLTAAIYATRAGLKTLVLAGEAWGGQPMLTTDVENFPGFPEGISGHELMAKIRKQAERHGAEIMDINYVGGDFYSHPFAIKAGDKGFEAKALIVATGATHRWLGVPGEQEKIGKGVSTCAPCDAAFFRNKKVIVVGGGDTAMQEALVISKFASEVKIVYRKDRLRASNFMQAKVKALPNVKVLYNTEIMEILGKDKVENVRLNSKLKTENLNPQLKTQNWKNMNKIQSEGTEIAPEEIGGRVIEVKGEELIWEIGVDGVFVAIGHVPNSKIFKDSGLEINEKGYIAIHDRTHTNISGIFAAGDVMDEHYRQSVTAAAFGAMAALEAERWLRRHSYIS